MPVDFDYLVRFADPEGKIFYGNITEDRPVESLVGTKIALLSGDPYSGFESTDLEATVSKVGFSKRKYVVLTSS
jgi:hypothetical protein